MKIDIKKIALLSILVTGIGCSDGWNSDDNVRMYTMCSEIADSMPLKSPSVSSVCACVRDEKIKKKYPSATEAKRNMSFEKHVQFIKECDNQ